MSQVQSVSTQAPEYNNRLPYTYDPCRDPCVPATPAPIPACSPCVDACGTTTCVATGSDQSSCRPACARAYDVGYGWGWLGALVLWFVVFTVLFWLIYYSLKPSFVLQSNSNQVDTAKVLLSAVISSLILVILIWLIKAAVSRRC